jgi:predicted transcriptional regulator
MAAVFSVRLNEDYTERLEALAIATGRSRNLLVNEAVARYVTEQEAYLAQVQEGIHDVEAGRIVPHAAVVQRLIDQGYMTAEGYKEALAELDRAFIPRADR